MSSVTFRESVVVIIDTSRTHIRAGLGLHDLLRTPAIEIPACVGIRPSAFSTLNGSDEQPQASTSNAALASAKVTDYLVGTQLDEALAAGQDVTVYWPFADGDVSDWTQAEALWKHVLFNQLQLRRIQMESPVLLSMMPGLSRDSYERVSQMFFERFNVAGFAVLDRPMAQFYATITGQDLSGVVIDVGQDYTDITPIHDGFPVHNARTSLKYGINDCERYLAYLLRSNQGVVSALSPPEKELSPDELDQVLVELSRHIWKEGLVKVLAEGEAADIEEEGVTDIAAVLVAGKEKAVIESGMKKRANAKATAAEQARAREIEALDLITVQFRELSLTLGKERHRFCEPLFDPTLLSAVKGSEGKPYGEQEYRALQAAVGHAVGQVEPDYRQYVWQGLLVTGELSNSIKGLGAALQARLSPFILSNADQMNEVQPKGIRVLKIPEYFAEYREKGDGLASFLGSSIVAKLTFTDSSGKNFVSKADYVSYGPSAVIDMSPMLL
ncbi:hypothetical protein EIP91_002023 [Steccherinum ochraceum]|uniref:Uncharacterized protein n=1 Tax=Steccherinum ochraceum TaxID=92696 RepID=A0A4R0RQ27_9APHY|nr:hypothetical protein EIP91_002023 [Steccherinum ochraceum]